MMNIYLYQSGPQLRAQFFLPHFHLEEVHSSD